MAANLIDLGQARDAAPGDLAGLQACLVQLVGEPFRFARVSYGDELTLHFGELSPSRSPKLANHHYGTYVLGLRASPWLLKAGTAPLVLAAGPVDFGKRLRKEDLEANPLIQPDSRVLSVAAFSLEPTGFGLQVRFSDGSVLHVVPSPENMTDVADDSLPELADWELTSPRGHLRAGPGLAWSYEPR